MYKREQKNKAQVSPASHQESEDAKDSPIQYVSETTDLKTTRRNVKIIKKDLKSNQNSDIIKQDADKIQTSSTSNDSKTLKLQNYKISFDKDQQQEIKRDQNTHSNTPLNENERDEGNDINENQSSVNTESKQLV